MTILQIVARHDAVETEWVLTTRHKGSFENEEIYGHAFRPQTAGTPDDAAVGKCRCELVQERQFTR
jgi:hypothetical protein